LAFAPPATLRIYWNCHQAVPYLNHLGTVHAGTQLTLAEASSGVFCRSSGRARVQGANGVVREAKRVEGDRLFVHLDYPDGGQEQFEWQLFSPAQMISMAESVGLTRLVACTDFDETTFPSPTNPRVQFLFERSGASRANIGHL